MVITESKAIKLEPVEKAMKKALLQWRKINRGLRPMVNPKKIVKAIQARQIIKKI